MCQLCAEIKCEICEYSMDYYYQEKYCLNFICNHCKDVLDLCKDCQHLEQCQFCYNVETFQQKNIPTHIISEILTFYEDDEDYTINEYMPRCQECNDVLTVGHLLTLCPSCIQYLNTYIQLPKDLSEIVVQYTLEKR